jgi:hypothetical protein
MLEGQLKIAQELAAEHPAEDVYRKEEIIATMDPMLAVETDTTAWDNAMQVRMMMQILAPGVQHGEKADVRSQVLGVMGNGLQCFGCGTKQDAVDRSFVLQGEWADFFWQREDDMEVGHVKEVLLSGFKPTSTSGSLTLRAVSIATGVVGDLLVSAMVTLLLVSPEGGGATANDIAQNLSLLDGR